MSGGWFLVLLAWATIIRVGFSFFKVNDTLGIAERESREPLQRAADECARIRKSEDNGQITKESPK